MKGILNIWFNYDGYKFEGSTEAIKEDDFFYFKNIEFWTNRMDIWFKEENIWEIDFYPETVYENQEYGKVIIYMENGEEIEGNYEFISD